MDVVALATVGSFVTSVIPLLFQAIAYENRRSKYETLRKSLYSQYKLIMGEKSDEMKTIVALLDTADLIMPHVVARFWRKLAILLAVALGCATASGVAFKLEKPSRAIIVWVAGVLINWALAVARAAKNENLLLSEYEKTFLENFSILQDTFYRRCVVYFIVQFNNTCDKLLSIQQKDFKIDTQKMNSIFLQELRTAMTKTLPPGEEAK